MLRVTTDEQKFHSLICTATGKLRLEKKMSKPLRSQIIHDLFGIKSSYAGKIF